MPTNLYSPLAAELSDPSLPPKKPGSPLKAVLIGLAIEIGGSMAAGFVQGFFYTIVWVRAGMPPGRFRETLGNIPSSVWLWMAKIVVEAAFSVLGGFTCARIADSKNYNLGVILASISCTIGLLFLFSSHHSLLMKALEFALGFGAVLLGTKLGISKNKRSATR